MQLNQLTENVEVIQTLGVHPNEENGLTGPDLQAKFDEGCRILKEYLNGQVVPAVNQNAEAIQQNKEAEDATLGDHAERLEKTENDLRDHKGRIEQLEQVNFSHNEALSQLSQQAADTAEAVAAHGNRLDVLETTTAQHGAQLLDITPRLERASIIDDSTVGTDAWSSKNIVDKLCPAFAESGEIAVCEPVEGYPLEVVSTIDAKEDGTEWTKVTLNHTGRNLLKLTYASNTVNGVTCTANGDGTYTCNGTATADTVFEIYANETKNAVPLFACGMILSGCPTGGSSSTYYLGLPMIGHYDYGAGRPVSYTAGRAASWTTSIQIVIKAGQTVRDLTFEPQITAGNKVYPFEPYRGEIITADLSNRPVSEGSYNWTTGVLINDSGNMWQHDPETGTFVEDDRASGLIVRKIPAFPGVNFFYSDCGDTNVSGKADPVAVIKKQEDRLEALEAAIINNT